MALIAMLAAAVSSADGSAGGVGEGRDGCDWARFGTRTLQLGDCGRDVKTLNWLLNSKLFAHGAPLGKQFRSRTEAAVVAFQSRSDLVRSGVADRRTSSRLVRSMRRDVATWYGPGFYGKRTACGKRLTRRTVGVAHRSLPCGTRVAIRYEGRFLRTRVIDRGPFGRAATWDLTTAAATRLQLVETDEIRSAVAG
jgi:rare lipoprotein A (peptidoglycan hydrolase)